MDRGIWIGVIGAVVTSFLFKAAVHVRDTELDKHGRLVLRYLYAPPLTAICSALFLGVGVIQWLDPFNHQQSGNLLLLSYIPALAGALAFCHSAYCFVYRVVLDEDSVHVRRWILGDLQVPIESIESIEESNNRFVLVVAPVGRHTFYKVLSGHQHFFRELRSRIKTPH